MRTHRKNVSVLSLLALTALAALAACGTESASGSGSDDGSGSGSGSVRTEPPLTGTAWTITAVLTGESASALPVGKEEKARLTFHEDGSVDGNLGCNGFSARVKAKGTDLAFGRVVSTKKMCPDPQMKLERSLIAVLDGTATYRIDHRTLSLTKKKGKGLQATATPAKTPRKS